MPRASTRPKKTAPTATVVRKRAILRAALEELARADYGGLTFERVAARAGVNKTTVYRQWPTKAALVRAALESCAPVESLGQSSGSLREDLLRIGRRFLEFAASFEGQGLVRLRLLDHPEPELAEMARALNELATRQLTAILGASVERGEMSPDIDPRLVLELLTGALHVRLFVKSERVDDVIISRIVDIIVAGVTPRTRARAKTNSTRR
jgi:AcrR family transcriptional regulator